MTVIDKAEAVSDKAVIWHYTTFASLVSILQNEKLWFTRLDKLRDPFEGRSEHSYKSGFHLLAEEHTREGCVNCWTIDDEESDLMWYAFAPDFGVAIRTTKGKLIASLKGLDTDEVEIGLVKYGEDFTTEPESYAFSKRKHFKRERELRAYTPSRPKYGRSSGIAIEPNPAGRCVPVDLRVMIEEVWVAPNSPDWFLTVVREEFAKYGCEHVAVRRREG
jgi:hypothetical protein